MSDPNPGTPPTLTPPAGDPPPAPPTVDMAEYNRLKDHKTKMDADFAKQREETRKLKETADRQAAVLREHGLSTDKTSEQRELERLQAASADRDFESGLLRSLAAKGYAFGQDDEDYGDVVIRKARKLKESGADTAGIIEGLKTGGWIKTPFTATATGGPPPPAPPTPTPLPKLPAPPASSAPPAPSEYDKVTTFSELGRLGAGKMADFAAKHPERYEALRSAHSNNLSRPRMPAFPIAAPVK